MIETLLLDNDRTLLYRYCGNNMQFDFIKVEQTLREVRVSYTFPFLGLMLRWLTLDDVSPFHITVQGWENERIDVDMNCTLTFALVKIDLLVDYLDQANQNNKMLKICVDLEDLLLHYQDTIRALQDRIGEFQKLILF
jgi:DNA repair exonuclease SbcCD nuclease subunit